MNVDDMDRAINIAAKRLHTRLDDDARQDARAAIVGTLPLDGKNFWYVVQIARSALITHHRRERIFGRRRGERSHERVPYIDEVQGEDALGFVLVEVGRVLHAMDKLPRIEREVLRRYFFDGEALETSIGPSLGLYAKGHAAKVKGRALRRLRTWLEEGEPSTPMPDLPLRRQRADYAGIVPLHRIMTCRGCGATWCGLVKRGKNPGRLRRWCTDECKNRWYALRNYREHLDERKKYERRKLVERLRRAPPVSCRRCGVEWCRVPHGRGRAVLYCSETCRLDAQREAKRLQMRERRRNGR